MKFQPDQIEKYFEAKGKKITDEFGWTGEFALSAKDIIDFTLDQYKSQSLPVDSKVEEAAEKFVNDYHFGIYSEVKDAAHKRGFIACAKWYASQLNRTEK